MHTFMHVIICTWAHIIPVRKLMKYSHMNDIGHSDWDQSRQPNVCVEDGCNRFGHCLDWTSLSY